MTDLMPKKLACLVLCTSVVYSLSFAFGSTKTATFHHTRTPRWATVGTFVELDSLKKKQQHRSIDEATWQLLNGTNVGEMNRSHFEAAETVVAAWSQRQTKRGALVVERLLRRIVKEQMAGNPYADCVDMTALYTNLIDGWAHCDEPGGAERAEEILDYFQTIYEDGDSFDPLLCGPSIRSFNAVIGAYSRSKRDDAPQQTIRVRAAMFKVMPMATLWAEPTPVSMQRILTRARFNSTYDCFQVLSKLQELQAEGRTTISPNKESYAHVLRAYANLGTTESPELVRTFLLHMEKLSEAYPLVRPDFNCHNVYIHAIAESMNKNAIPGSKAVRLVEGHVYKVMMASNDATVQPDKWSFNMLLSILNRSGVRDMIERAEDAIARMEAYHEKSGRSEKTQPNVNSYNTLMTCFTRFGSPEKAQKALDLLARMKRLGNDGNPNARPDTVTYNVAMNAMAKSQQRDAAVKVEELLNEMNDEFTRTGDVRIRPNRRSINTCLDAWAKCGLFGADDRIMSWIEKMKVAHDNGQSQIHPDIWSYTIYLQALSKSGRPNMGEEAERILMEMEDLCHRGYQSVKPNVLTYTNVIHCIALSGQDDAVERALALLDRMEDLHASGGGDVRPNLFTYNCVINTVAKSKRRGKAEIALQLLRRIKSVALRPGSVSFNNVINACAFSNHPDDDSASILRIALDVLKQAQDGPGANWITYQSTIRVICTFETDPEKRWRLTRRVLQECCHDGQLTKTVLTQVRFAVSEAQYGILEREVTDPVTKKLLEKYTVFARRTMFDNKAPAFRA